MAFSMVDSLLIWYSPVTASRHFLFEGRLAELHSLSWLVGIEWSTIEECICLLGGAQLFGVNSNREA